MTRIPTKFLQRNVGANEIAHASGSDDKYILRMRVRLFRNQESESAEYPVKDGIKIFEKGDFQGKGMPLSAVTVPYVTHLIMAEKKSIR